MNVKIYNFNDNLINRIIFKTCILRNSKVHVIIIFHSSSYLIKNLEISKWDLIALRIQLYSLIHLHLRNSESFFSTNKLISNLFNIISSIYKINVNISWNSWRKLVKSLKLWCRKKIFTKIFDKLWTIITALYLISKFSYHHKW